MTVSPVLIGRFKGTANVRCIFTYVSNSLECRTEREENVKADIFHAYIALLKQTKPTLATGRDDREGLGTNQEIYNMLVSQVPLIVKATSKQMKVVCNTPIFFLKN